MSHFDRHEVPDANDDSRRWPESDDTPTVYESLHQPIDRSRKYAAAIESSKHVNVSGLCRLWDHWRDSPHLTWMLHGFLMACSINTEQAAWTEIDLLTDILRIERDEP